jgi:hypothetical protein
MAMGTRKKGEVQEPLWIVSQQVVSAPANAFYERLNQILDEHNFDRNVEHNCTNRESAVPQRKDRRMERQH